MKWSKWWSDFISENSLLIWVPSIFVIALLTVFFLIGLQEPETKKLDGTTTFLTSQVTLRDELLANLEATSYTETNPYVLVNPFEIAPLTALVIFDTDQVESYQITVSGKGDAEDYIYQSTMTKHHVIPIYGLYPDFNNVVSIHRMDTVLGEVGDLVNTLSIVTTPLPAFVNEAVSVETTPEYFLDDWMIVMPFDDTDVPVAIDRNGDVRWYTTIPLSFIMEPLQNGNFIVGGERRMKDPYYSNRIYEMDLVGQIHASYAIPGGFHHDVAELPSGNLLVLSNEFDGTVEDIIVEVDRDTGEIVEFMDLETIVGSKRSPAEMASNKDWIHASSIEYDETTNSILVTARNQDIILNIDYDTLTINYILGDPTNWVATLVNQRFLIPTETPFAWPYGATSAVFATDGDILVFDNGNNRSKNPESYLDADDNFSRGILYDINFDTRGVDVVTSYGTHRGSSFYSPDFGHVAYYADNHFMVHSGGIVENEDGPINIPVYLSEETDLITSSITAIIQDGITEYQLVMPENYASAWRIDPSDYVNIQLVSLQVLGQSAVTPQMQVSVDTRFGLFHIVPPTFELYIKNEGDYLIVAGEFDLMDEVYFELISGDDIIRYSIPMEDTSARIKSFDMISSERVRLEFVLEFTDLSGQYELFLRVNGRQYETYQYININ